MTIIPNVFIEKVIIWLIAHRSILNPKQTCIQNMEDTVFSTHSLTATVVHVLSVRPVDPYKSPLYPPIQGLRAAAHRLEPTLVQAA